MYYKHAQIAQTVSQRERGYTIITCRDKGWEQTWSESHRRRCQDIHQRSPPPSSYTCKYGHMLQMQSLRDRNKGGDLRMCGLIQQTCFKVAFYIYIYSHSWAFCHKWNFRVFLYLGTFQFQSLCPHRLFIEPQVLPYLFVLIFWGLEG